MYEQSFSLNEDYTKYVNYINIYNAIPFNLFIPATYC